jgi:DNA-binding transcriptional regulator LsrR (DeoR family)
MWPELISWQVSDEIAKLKYKEPQSTKIVQLEQELVRAEAQSLVAEAQLTNIVRILTRYQVSLLTVPDSSEVQGSI